MQADSQLYPRGSEPQRGQLGGNDKNRHFPHLIRLGTALELTLGLTLGLTAPLVLGGCSTDSDSTSTSTSASAEITNEVSTGANMSGCIDSNSFDANKDYFPDKVTFEQAKNVQVSYHKSYKVLSIGAADHPSQKVVMVQCGAPTPELEGDLSGATVMNVPTGRLAASSTTQIPVLQKLGVLDQVVGTSDLSLLYPDPARKELEKQDVISYAPGGGQVDAEKVIQAKPDAVLADSTMVDGYKQVSAAGIPVLQDADYLETTPLARAEWLKVYSLLVNKEAAASHDFSDISHRYEDVAAKAREAKDKPTVLLGSETKGQWYVPGSDSYMASFIADAGGDYVMKDSAPGSESATVDEELVFDKGAEAEFWLNGNSMATTAWKSTADVIKANPKYNAFKAVHDGNVWNPTRRTATDGGNDYWESGVIQPDVVLLDLVAIFHPNLAKDHQQYYYQKTEK